MNGLHVLAVPDQASLWGLNVFIHATVLTAASLLIALLFRRAAAMRYWVLCFALVLVFISPVISGLIQATGRSWLTITVTPVVEAVTASSPIKPDVSGSMDDVSQANEVDLNLLADAFAMQPVPHPDVEQITVPLADNTAVGAAAIAPTPESMATLVPATNWLKALLRFVILPLILTWVLGAAVLLLRMSIGWLRMSRILRAAKPIADERFRQAFDRACQTVGCRRDRRPQLVASDAVSGPIAAGVLRGTVVFPRGVLRRVDPESLADVLVHEIAHIVRHDPIALLFQNLVSALYWPHPLVRKLNVELARAREEVCDNFVLAGTGAPRYGRTLLSLAQLVQQPATMPGSVGFFTSRWRLENRIAGLLDTKRDRTTFLSKRGWLFVTATTVSLALLTCLGTITIAGGSALDLGDVELTTAKPRPPKKASVSVRGQVRGPNGQPIAATLWIGGPARSMQWSRTPMSVDWTQVGKSGSDGRFQVTIPQTDEASAPSPPASVRLAATADGLGFAWADIPLGPSHEDVTLRLVEDLPIRGRIVTVDGTPAAKVELNVAMVTAADSIPDSLAVIKSAALNSGMYTNWPAWPGGSPLTKSVVTDSQGRFRITGLGSERFVRLEVLGDGVGATRLSILTREKPSDSASGAIAVRTGLSESSYFADFTHVAIPERIIRGVVVDKTSGQPIPDVQVHAPTSWASRKQPALTDAEGQFVIRHVPMATKYALELTPSDASHFRANRSVSDTTESESLDVKLAVTRGIKLRGRAVDEVTGQGVQGEIVYNALFPNDAVETLGGDIVANPLSSVRTDTDGSFEIAVLPGRGAVSVRVAGAEYANVVLSEQALRKIFPDGPLESRPDTHGHFISLCTAAGGQRRGLMGLSNVHGVALLNMRQDGPANEITLKLRRSHTLQGEIVDHEGNPVSGSTVIGLGPSWTSITPEPLETNRFTVNGLLPESSRTLLILQQDRSLGASIDVKGDQSDVLKVELKPTGSITGLLVDANGDPITNAQVYLMPERHGLLTELWTADADDVGRFTIDQLLEGVAFSLRVRIEGQQLDLFVRGEISTKGGEHRDLGVFRQRDKHEFVSVDKMQASPTTQDARR